MIGDQEEFNQLETNQRMENLIRIGTVFEVDPVAAKVRIETGDVITGWLSWLALFAGVDRDWSAPSVGEQVVILSPSGDLAQGVVLRSLYQSAHAAPDSDPDMRKTVYSDGTEITLNKNAQQLTITVSGNEGDLIVNAAKVVVNSDNINLGGEGWVCEVWQSAYGHRANKATWLYYKGENQPFGLRWGRPVGTHQIGYQDKRGKAANKPTLSKREANATPLAFRDELIRLALQKK